MNGLAWLVRTWRAWRRRRYELELLAGMDAAQLQDIGITRADALEELARPWWRRNTRG
ncbi:DUF1127 domain-containing protein [Halopseudomonas maritima]|uniref:DUF1127 domain-containing protein n=1 Tax=Halopseudomonas maritima TaxID=2918528 RepID=UPI001EEBBC8C|nr:DUF1127 domain-containing protein [Halopseudomonas maritima]UJJ32917.1 DUF1127 domain-containing protein [Halopseudomonas maritima]